MPWGQVTGHTLAKETLGQLPQSHKLEKEERKICINCDQPSPQPTPHPSLHPTCFEGFCLFGVCQFNYRPKHFRPLFVLCSSRSGDPPPLDSILGSSLGPLTLSIPHSQYNTPSIFHILSIPHSQNSTLLVFYTLSIPHSQYSTLSAFHTLSSPHSQYSPLSVFHTLSIPPSLAASTLGSILGTYTLSSLLSER